MSNQGTGRGDLVHHVQTIWMGTEQHLMRTTNSNYKFVDSRNNYSSMDLGRMNGLQVFHQRLSSSKINRTANTRYNCNALLCTRYICSNFNPELITFKKKVTKTVINYKGK